MKRIVIALILPALIGCSTIQNGPMQRVQVDSEPAGAEVRAERCGRYGTKLATTPATMWVSRRSKQCRLLLTLPDREVRTIPLKRVASAGARAYSNAAEDLCADDLHNCNSVSDLVGMTIVGAMLFLPSIAVDLAFGSIFEQTPHRIDVTFDEPADAQR